MKIEHNNPWLFNNKEFTDDDVGDYAGFVYLITNIITNEKYIGRKYFTSTRKLKKFKRRKTSASDWKTYWGSSDTLNAAIEKHGHENFKREILSLHVTKGDVNYQEVRYQFKFDILEKIGYYNENINGKWFRKPKHISDRRKLAESMT